mmetsp:Transcript_1930/g.4345  ORF Transcript_1930/g.4345 Transcript_1930/m.4345 type:complete len:225 (+) Transcript_1930:3691-4365(+)
MRVARGGLRQCTRAELAAISCHFDHAPLPHGLSSATVLVAELPLRPNGELAGSGGRCLHLALLTGLNLLQGVVADLSAHRCTTEDFPFPCPLRSAGFLTTGGPCRPACHRAGSRRGVVTWPDAALCCLGQRHAARSTSLVCLLDKDSDTALLPDVTLRGAWAPDQPFRDFTVLHGFHARTAGPCLRQCSSALLAAALCRGLHHAGPLHLVFRGASARRPLTPLC